MPGVMEWLMWRLLHLLFALACVVSAVITRFREYLSAIRGSEKSEGRVMAAADKPLTVAVVFENEEVVDKDGKIPQLLFWLSAANVSHVTLFDAQGALKRSQAQLQKILNSMENKDQKILCYSDKQAEFLSELNGSQYWREVLSISKNPIYVDDKHLQNELKSSRRRTSEGLLANLVDDEPEFDMAAVSHMKVELLSLQDGKGSLVRAARHVCENAYKIHYAQQSAKATKLTEEDINKSLQETGCEGPDPDLLLLFGLTRSLLGFPPWRLRLTEIVHMGSLKDLTPHLFVSALKEFAKKTHRYGR